MDHPNTELVQYQSPHCILAPRRAGALRTQFLNTYILQLLHKLQTFKAIHIQLACPTVLYSHQPSKLLFIITQCSVSMYSMIVRANLLASLDHFKYKHNSSLLKKWSRLKIRNSQGGGGGVKVISLKSTAKFLRSRFWPTHEKGWQLIVQTIYNTVGI